MKKKTVLFVLFFFCMLLAFSNGCKKGDEIKNPEITTAAPHLPPSPETKNKSGLQIEEEMPIISKSTPDKPLVEAPTPSKEPPAATPATPSVSAVPCPSHGLPEVMRENDIVTVAKFESAEMQKGAPAGWILDKRKGKPVIKLEKGSEIYCLHMQSDKESSFGVKKGIKIDIREYPYLNWRWKVARLPNGGDVRKTCTDDQAIQLYVAFTPTGFPVAINTNVLGYIWDGETPKGWTGRSSHFGGGKLKYIVVRNKTDQLGQWYTEKRNIYNDYKALFKDTKGGELPGLTHGVQFHINSQNTASEAEGYICEVYFSKT